MFTFAATDVLTSNIELSVFLLLDLFFTLLLQGTPTRIQLLCCIDRQADRPASKEGAEWSRSRSEGHYSSIALPAAAAVCSWPTSIYLGSLV